MFKEKHKWKRSYRFLILPRYNQPVILMFKLFLPNSFSWSRTSDRSHVGMQLLHYAIVHVRTIAQERVFR